MLKKGMFFLFILSLGFSHIQCQKPQKVYTQAELAHNLDSIMQIKQRELEREAKKDLDLRSSIEIKPMVDSLSGKRIGPSSRPSMDTSEINFGNSDSI